MPQFSSQVGLLAGARSVPWVAVVVVAMAVGAGVARAQSFTAEEYYDSLVANPQLNQEPGELWAWHANWGMGQFTKAYQAYGDASWLEQGVRYYDHVIDHMREAPDGYMGWIGPLPGDGARTDEHIGDAILTRHMLEFAEIVKNDASLDAQFGAKADAYVELTKVHLIEKWDARDTYHKVGDVGLYEWWDQELPEDLSAWQHNADRHDTSVTQQFNKQTAMATNALRLYRITGEQQYRERAYELFAFLKSHMQLHDDAYVWNFRDPALREDIDSVHFNDIKTWMAVHPSNAGYQASEVRDIVEAFHSGIVFDQIDIERLINTQLEVMWNGDIDNPSYTGPDALTRDAGAGAGTYWAALAYFDETLRELHGGPGSNKRSEIDYDHFINVVMGSGPSFDRQHVDESGELYLFDWAHSDSRSLSVVFLTDPVFTPGEGSTIVGSNALRATEGTLEVALFDADGEAMLMVLATEADLPSWGTYLFEWDGTDALGNPLDPGDYRVRWTFSIDSHGDEGYREYPLTLVPEPATLAMLGITGLTLMLRRRPQLR